MALIRFVSPTSDLKIDAVPATFVDFVCDIDAEDTDRLSKMRYLGLPYGVREMGSVSYADPYPQYVSHDELTAILDAQAASDVVGQVTDPNSDLYQALASQFATKGELGGSSGGSAIKVYTVADPTDPTSVDASGINDNTLVALTNVSQNG